MFQLLVRPRANRSTSAATKFPPLLPPNKIATCSPAVIANPHGQRGFSQRGQKLLRVAPRQKHERRRTSSSILFSIARPDRHCRGGLEQRRLTARVARRRNEPVGVRRLAVFKAGTANDKAFHTRVRGATKDRGFAERSRQTVHPKRRFAD